jgi:hypothetical protein
MLTELENFPLYGYDAKSFDDVRPRVDDPEILSGYCLETNNVLHITLYSHGYIVFSFVTNLQMLSDW